MKKIFTISLFTLSSSLFTFCNAQYAVIHDFSTSSGDYPYGSLTYDKGLLYGMVPVGGTNGLGRIFSIDTTGNNYTSLFDFNGATGAFPQFGWPGNTLTISGNVLYGMTPVGGIGYGNIFSINTNGSGYKDLFDMDSLDGAYPFGQLAIYGNVMYGMASYGGTNGDGCVFSINTNGSGYKIIYNFNGLTGSNPFGSLIVSGNNLYGMCNNGGANNLGDIFTLQTNGGNFNDLLDFNALNGMYPQNSLIRSGKVMYGMTFRGGPDSAGNVFSIDTDGTNYRTLLNFNVTNGAEPFGNLTLSGAVLYGMAGLGGADNAGIIFSIDTDASNFTDMHDCTSVDGSYPIGSTTISGSTLFGMTNLGGTHDSGVIFRYYTPHDTGSGLGINTIIANKSTIYVYPNPSNGKFIIQMDNEQLKMDNEKPQIEIYNVLGQQVYSQFTTHPSQFTIDLSSNPSGVYFYRVIANSGELIGEGKLVIEK